MKTKNNFFLRACAIRNNVAQELPQDEFSNKHLELVNTIVMSKLQRLREIKN